MSVIFSSISLLQKLSQQLQKHDRFVTFFFLSESIIVKTLQGKGHPFKKLEIAYICNGWETKGEQHFNLTNLASRMKSINFDHAKIYLVDCMFVYS